MGNFERGKYSRGNQSDANSALFSEAEGLAKNDWHELYWMRISMVDCLFQTGMCGSLGIEGERMDFGMGIGLEVGRVSEAMGERGTKDKCPPNAGEGGLFSYSFIFVPGC